MTRYAFKYHYIPSSVDPNWLTDRSGLPFDQAIHVLSLITQKYFSRRGIDDFTYKPICAWDLQRLVKKYRKVLDVLRTEGIVADNGYEPGYKCRGYRITDLHINSITTIPVKTDRFKLSLSRAKKSEIKRRFTPVHYLDKWFLHSELHFDHKKAEQILQQNLQKAATLKERENWASSSLIIEQIKSKEYDLGRDHTSGRYHSPITMLNSDFRSCFSFGGESFHQFDITNCVAYLAQILYDPRHILSVLPSLRYFRRACPSSFPNLDNHASLIMLGKTLETPVNREIRRFRKSANNGTLYEDFLALIKKDDPTLKMTRDDTKTAFYQAVYSSNKFRGKRPDYPKYDATAKELFIENYPYLNRVMEMIKEDRHNALAILIQNLEAHIIIEKCSARITKERPDIPLLTIHDGIATTLAHLPYLRQVLEEECIKIIHFKPTLTIKSWQ